MKTATYYTVFAIIATVTNILSQDVTLRFYTGDKHVFLSVLVGTVAGLVVKYILDKKFIFDFQTQNSVDDGKVFMLYSMTGVFTTIIFWGLELGFDIIFQTKTMRYVGGIIGLAIGYMIKYQLDKRYVFVDNKI